MVDDDFFRFSLASEYAPVMRWYMLKEIRENSMFPDAWMEELDGKPLAEVRWIWSQFASQDESKEQRNVVTSDGKVAERNAM